MVIRSGPMIEGVVSPTVSSATRRTALESAKTPGTYQDQYQYTLANNALQSGMNTTQAGNLLSLSGLGQAGSLQPTTAPTTAPMQLDGMGGGWVPDPNGGYHNIYSGEKTSGVGGGGTGAGGTAPISDPSGVAAPTGPGGPDTLGGASSAAIEAQINALTAQYGLDLEGIAALGGEIGAQARFLMAQLSRDQSFAQEDLLGNLVGRGVFRSGITARDTGRLQGDFAARRAQVEMNKGVQLRQLAERAGIAKAGLSRGKADVITEIDNANLPAELRQIMLNELNSLTPEMIQAALAQQKPVGELELTDEDLRNRQTVGVSGSNLGGY